MSLMDATNGRVSPEVSEHQVVRDTEEGPKFCETHKLQTP